MQYKYLKEKENYELYAAGRVLYSVPGSAPFPVRLIDEIFQRACEMLDKKSDLRLLDPCIGSGYMMTVLGFLHYKSITLIDGSDINESILEVAKKNVKLLTKEGIEQRIEELDGLITKFGKDSHKAAIIDAEILKQKIADVGNHIITTHCVAGSIDKVENLFSAHKYDLIILDSPYGNLTSWGGDITIEKIYIPMSNLLAAGGVIVMITDKSVKFNVIEGYKKNTLNLGKRRITFIKRDF